MSGVWPRTVHLSPHHPSQVREQLWRARALLLVLALVKGHFPAPWGQDPAVVQLEELAGSGGHHATPRQDWGTEENATCILSKGSGIGVKTAGHTLLRINNMGKPTDFLRCLTSWRLAIQWLPSHQF